MSISLYVREDECCACGACMNICPRDAIEMKENDFGFNYPMINYDKCISCKLCKKVCNYQNSPKVNQSIDAYVAISKNTDILKSASGGAFASIAKEVIINNGIVYGASMEFKESQVIVKHIGINSINELYKLQGSKYVQSEIGNIFRDVKYNLENSKLVLFSGTPCQIDGLNGYLNKQYDNLLTIDIICHGVPSNKMFDDYIKILEGKLKRKIKGYYFRDKQSGWGLNGKIELCSSSGKYKNKYFEYWESSYYELFLNSDIYRENCYSCKYASLNRPGDITLGDFWGIEKEHQDLLDGTKDTINIKNGVSGVIVNTKKGERYLNKYGNGLSLYYSNIDKICKHNVQLSKPSIRSNRRDYILDKYKKDGYMGIEKWFIREKGLKLRVKVLIKKVKTLIRGNI